MDLLSRIDALIDEHHLLQHSFYQKWTAGTLPMEAMQEYARQYFAFESSFPQVLSALHSRTPDAEVRQHLLENLWDEEHGERNHAELWLQFAEGIGVDREDVKSAPRNQATTVLLETYERLSREAPVAAGVAAVYAYERQVPEVAGSKIDGLKRSYGIDSADALRFFVVHGELDVEHSGAEREMVSRLAGGTESARDEEILDATRQALVAWQDFLTAVDLPAREPVSA